MATAEASQALTKPGDYIISIPYQGQSRFYHVHVPAEYSPARALPLLVAFHGGGGDMEYMAKDQYYGLISKAERSSFIVVFPNGFSKFQSGKLATWNAGACCGDARDREIDDIGFTRAMLANLTRQLNIDRGRIYATGMSNGGMMAERVACDMADTFKAVASVAGTDNTLSCTPARPVSVLNIHAQNDDHVLFNGGAGAGSFRDESKVNNFTSVPETVKRWTARNQCSAGPQRVLSVEGAYCDLYSGCAQGVKVELCVTAEGGHSWPGGYKPRGGAAASQAISADDVMWDFFKSLP